MGSSINRSERTKFHKRNSKTMEFSERKIKRDAIFAKKGRRLRSSYHMNMIQLGPLSKGSLTLTLGIAKVVPQDGQIVLQGAKIRRPRTVASYPNQLDGTPYFIKDHILNEMMTVLTQSDIFMVGLYGTNYGRKSNMIEKIIRRVEKDGQFDVIVTADMVKKKNKWWNKSLDVRKIQKELGIKLGLQLQEKKLEERASRLSDRIKMKQNILIILENLSSEINLAKIGIPFNNNHKGCKIILVSENQEVLNNKMKAQIVFSLDD